MKIRDSFPSKFLFDETLDIFRGIHPAKDDWDFMKATPKLETEYVCPKLENTSNPIVAHHVLMNEK